MKFKNKLSVYQLPFNQTFKGRSYRKYFVVFTTLLTAKDQITLNVRIIAGIGSNENKKVYNLS